MSFEQVSPGGKIHIGGAYAYESDRGTVKCDERHMDFFSQVRGGV